MSADKKDKPSRCTQNVLAEQILWLIRLRWIATGGIVVAVLVGSYVFPYPLLPSQTPIYICAAILLLCNYLYFCVATKKTSYFVAKDTVLAMVQVEVDLVILTAVLLFSGGRQSVFPVLYISRHHSNDNPSQKSVIYGGINGYIAIRSIGHQRTQ